jgi:hypothetical protein
MSVLEDAIREHLELKRRHGAADEELRRQEAEALGPARRQTLEPVEAPEELVEPVAAGGDVPEPARAEEDLDELGSVESRTTVPEGSDDEIAPLLDDEVEALDADQTAPTAEPEIEEDQAPMSMYPPDPDAPEPALPPTPELAPEADEDMLDETPDFLPGTLEDEQKPPCDFDFD